MRWEPSLLFTSTMLGFLLMDHEQLEYDGDSPKYCLPYSNSTGMVHPSSAGLSSTVLTAPWVSSRRISDILSVHASIDLVRCSVKAVLRVQTTLSDARLFSIHICICFSTKHILQWMKGLLWAP
jgi:hypothetical protein